MASISHSHGKYEPLAATDVSTHGKDSAGTPASSLFQAWKLGGICLLWLMASSTIILVNRIIMVDLDFSYPMAVAAMGMGFASCATWLWCDMLKKVPPPEGVTALFFLTRIMPVGACGGLTLFLGNSMYFHLTVAFIEMSRASMPIMTMTALTLAGMEVPTRQVVAAVTVVGIGSAIAAYGEINLSLVGGLLALGNLTMESARMVMTQFLLVGCNMHPLQSLKLTAPATTITLLAGSMLSELPDMRSSGAFGIVRRYPLQFLLAASMGLVVNILSVVIIKMASATTLKVLAAVRGPLVVLFGVMLFSEHVTLLEFFGYSIALVGFVWYQFALNARIKAPPASPQVTVTKKQLSPPRHEGHDGRQSKAHPDMSRPLLPATGQSDVESGSTRGGGEGHRGIAVDSGAAGKA